MTVHWRACRLARRSVGWSVWPGLKLELFQAMSGNALSSLKSEQLDDKPRGCDLLTSVFHSTDVTG